MKMCSHMILKNTISIFLITLLSFILMSSGIAEEKSDFIELDNSNSDSASNKPDIAPGLAEKRILFFEKQRKSFPNATNLPGPEDAQKELKKVRRISVGSVVYPAELRRTRQEGLVTVALLIGENGDVVDTSIVESTNSKLNRSAILSMRSWKFSPMFLDNVPFKSVVIVPMAFKVNN
jgi:TonB family protein